MKRRTASRQQLWRRFGRPSNENVHAQLHASVLSRIGKELRDARTDVELIEMRLGYLIARGQHKIT